MLKARHLAIGAAVIGAVVVAAPATAGAEAQQPSAAYAGRLVTGGGGPTALKITYTCSSTDSPLNHLYVGVKQGPKVNTTNHSGSSWAKTFYSTNWMSDQGQNALNCDGVEHTQRIVLEPQPGFEAKVPRLHKGLAFVQICVYDNVTGFDPGTGEPVGGFAASYTMERVHTRNHS